MRRGTGADWGRLGTGGLGPTRSAGKGRDERRRMVENNGSGGKGRGDGAVISALGVFDSMVTSGCQVE